MPKSLVPEPVEPRAPRPKLTPLSPQRVGWQFTVDQSTHEKMRYAQALLGHQVPAGEIAALVDRAFDALIGELEKTRFAATSRTRPGQHGSSADPRRIPAHVKRAVWERDGGQCGFVSEAGQRCPARTRLEFDHADPVARGGEATVEGIRLRCRTHNQYEAECVFGAGFMSDKREAVVRAAAARRAQRERVAAERAAARKEKAQTAAANPSKDVLPWLSRLGVRVEESRRAAALCETLPPEAPLEERVRFALRHLAPPHRRVEARTATAT